MKIVTSLLLLQIPVAAVYAQTNTFPVTGHAGVGTTAPLRKLHVSGGLMINSFRTTNTGEIDTLYFGKDHTSGGGYYYSLGEIRSYTSNGYAGGLNFYTGRNLGAGNYGPVHAMTINEDGFLGIGTASPSAKLTVEGAGAANETILRVNNQGDYASRIMLRNSGQTAYFSLGGSTADILASGMLAQSLAFGVHGDVPVQFYNGVSASVKMTVAGNGNVGIGTISPAQRLEVNGGVQVSGSPGLVLANSSSGYPGSGTVYGFVSRSGGGGGSYPWNTAGTVVFQSESWPGTAGFAFATGSTPTVKLTVQGNGNVGIGTNSPAEKLTVEGNISANGTIKSKKVTVTQTGWADYVFNSDYKLRSLSSLEAFISKYKHLPEIPAAKEVEENGISVGDNQALLLKKIEELILYVIQLEKKTNRQQVEIDKLKKPKP